MKRFLSIRAYTFALVSLLFSIGIVGPQIAQASVTPSGHVLFQDLGDDDGDGIPNYLDPDNDNNGITDENETTQPQDQDNSTNGGNSNPSPTPTPPTATNPPAKETPKPPVSSGTSNPAVTNPDSTSTSPSTSSDSAPVVTSLPVTGIGHSPALGWQLAAFSALGLSIMAASVRSLYRRM